MRLIFNCPGESPVAMTYCPILGCGSAAQMPDLRVEPVYNFRKSGPYDPMPSKTRAMIPSGLDVELFAQTVIAGNSLCRRAGLWRS